MQYLVEWDPLNSLLPQVTISFKSLKNTWGLEFRFQTPVKTKQSQFHMGWVDSVIRTVTTDTCQSLVLVLGPLTSTYPLPSVSLSPCKKNKNKN